MDHQFKLGYSAKTLKNSLFDIWRWAQFVAYQVDFMDHIPTR
jgi:hypothetical protein